MRIIRGIHSLKHPLRGSVVTVGVFDGVHIGHRKVIKEVVARAKALSLKSVVVTFDPHPVKVLTRHVKVPSLISLQHRLELFEEMGVDIACVLAFTKALAGISPERFVQDILVGKLGAKEIYVGGNFFFGRGAKAGAGTLLRLSKRSGFKARAIEPLKMSGKVVSSSLIRDLITRGETSKASKLLGRPVSILGTVVHGAKIGRILGFPTANINPHHEAIPPGGVYAVKARLGPKLLSGILNIGTRPTFHIYSHELEPTIEVHLFGFNKNIYGRDMEVVFVKKIRGERKFRSKTELVEQIKRDVRRVKGIVGSQ